MATQAMGFAPLSAASGREIELSMQRLWLSGRVMMAGARLRVEHDFESAETKPLEAVYSFLLPRDAALRRFTVRGQDFTVHSSLRPTAEAEQTYEKGLREGSLSTLARQYADGVMNLTVGNIRPGERVSVRLEILAGVEARDDGFRFRFPFTLAPGYHRRARMAQVEPGEGSIELPEDEFGDRMLPRFRQDAAGLHTVGFDLHLVAASPFAEVASPSHAVRVCLEGALAARVGLAAAGDLPDRDLVLDARMAETRPQLLAGAGTDGKVHFIGMVPSTCFGPRDDAPRRVVVLLDRSGSMSGSPMHQACKAIEACLGALSPADRFGLIAFDDQIDSFQDRLVPATRENRDQARQWLRRIAARGGTELAAGVRAAVNLAGSGADILLFTDGQVFGTERILAEARAVQVRLHCLGIGSASQDRFLALLARETGGVSRFVTPDERVDMTAVELFASVGRPVASEVTVKGAAILPEPPAFVFSGTPLVFYGEAPSGDAIELAWRGGSLRLPVEAGTRHTGETVRLLRGARLITDFESRYGSEQTDKRTQKRIAARLQELSQAFGLASREMSLVAIVERPGDQPGDVPVTRVVPVGVPKGTRFDSYFPLRGTVGGPPAMMTASFAPAAAPPVGRRFSAPAEADLEGLETAWRRMAKSFHNLFASAPAASLPKAAAPQPETAADILLDLAASLDADGGLPGSTPGERVLRSIVALLAFLSEGHSLSGGAFRPHVQRLADFLNKAAEHGDLAVKAVARARAGTRVPGPWMDLARSGEVHRADLEKALP